MIPDLPPKIQCQIALTSPLVITLNDRQRFILEKRADGWTLKQIGNEFKITGERVRQLEKKAKRRLEGKR